MYPISVDELVDVTFWGAFFRDPKHVEADLKEARADNVRHPGALDAHYKNRGVFDDPYKFTFVIGDYNPETGLYTATIDDFFGESKGVGGILLKDRWDNTIKFAKVYSIGSDPHASLTANPSLFHDSQNFRVIECSGTIDKEQETSNKIAAQGKYIYGAPCMAGFWYMSNQEEDEFRDGIMQGLVKKL
ncbi:MAG: hypothetical protein V3V78_01650 [Candidatus Woesearchaeota archaeon]